MNLTAGIHETPATPVHWPFILDSFRKSLASLSHVASPRAHTEGLERLLRGRLGSAVVATPAGHPDTYLGWAVAIDGALLFAYVPAGLRRLGIARQMVAELFTSGPVHLVYWTDTAERIQRAGFPLVHDWQEFARRSRAAERVARWAARPPQLLHERTA